MDDLLSGRLILPKPKTALCAICLGSFPVVEGSKAVNCEDWVEETLKRLPGPIPFSIFLQLASLTRMCRINAMLKLLIYEFAEPEDVIRAFPDISSVSPEGG